jgi:hypothetical protein
MNEFAIQFRPKLITRTSPWVPCPALEELFPWMEGWEVKRLKQLLHMPLRDRIEDLWRAMSGSTAFTLSKAIQDIPLGATAFALTNTTIYFGLWAAALDDTLAGNTATECAYTSYGRLALTNNTTIFAAGTGTTTYTKTFPSDAVKSFAASTGTGTNNTVTYLGMLNGNAGTSADKGYYWCSITSTVINSGDTPQLAVNAMTVVQD